MAASTEGLTKSAKKRMAQKAKAAAGEAAEAEAPQAAAPPAPEPKAKGKAKAKPEAAKEAAAPKAAAAAAAPKAAPEPEKPAAKGKAKAKADAKAKAEPKAAAKAEPAKAEASAEPKAAAKGKAKAKGKAAAQPAQAAAAPVEELPVNVFLDDGTGDAWETTAKNKKDKKDKKQAQQEAAGVDTKAAAPASRGARAAPAIPEDAAARRQKAKENAEAEVARILGMKSESPELPVATAHCDSIIVPEPRIGIVIGPKGQTIQLIQEKSKAARIDTASGVFTISGEEDAVKLAKGYIKDVVDRGYCTLYYEDFAEGSINVHPQYFPDIIGPSGSIIKEIKKQLKVEVSMPDLPAVEVRKETQKFPVRLAGSAKQVEEAKECIDSIMKYAHSEITHPGQTHAEMEVEDWTYSFIIGRGGSELKHIQKNWEVRVNIPRANSVNQNVLIVGAPENVERAKAYVEKLIQKAEEVKANPREREEKKDVGDKWVDKDDVVDPGLEGYIYKR